MYIVNVQCTHKYECIYSSLERAGIQVRYGNLIFVSEKSITQFGKIFNSILHYSRAGSSVAVVGVIATSF